MVLMCRCGSGPRQIAMLCAVERGDKTIMKLVVGAGTEMSDSTGSWTALLWNMQCARKTGMWCIFLKQLRGQKWTGRKMGEAQLLMSYQSRSWQDGRQSSDEVNGT